MRPKKRPIVLPWFHPFSNAMIVTTCLAALGRRILSPSHFALVGKIFSANTREGLKGPSCSREVKDSCTLRASTINGMYQIQLEQGCCRQKKKRNVRGHYRKNKQHCGTQQKKSITPVICPSLTTKRAQDNNDVLVGMG